nr:MlaD family protein [uncultured Flavobacterium sp.]
MIKIILVFLITFLVSSCNFKKNYEVNVLYRNVQGLNENSKVYTKGVLVGNIEEFKLYDQGVLVKLKISNKYKFTTKSTFEIKDNSILGPKIIDVNYISSTTLIHNNDTIIGIDEIRPSTIKLEDIKVKDFEINLK